MWYATPLSRADLFARLRYLEPNADLRAKWQYQNLMFMAAGHLAERLTGASWEDLVRQRLFAPLGMARSNLSVEFSKSAADHALPCALRDEKVAVLPFRNIDAVGPAGSINSCAADMAQWLRFNLTGKAGSQSLLAPEVLAELHKPQMVVGDQSADAEVSGRTYALGWFVDHYRGRVRVHHGGNIDGFSCAVSFVPEAKVGVVVLANLDGTPFVEAVARTALDRTLGLEPVPWSKRLLARAEIGKQAGKKAEQRADVDRKPGTHPAHSLDDYLGTYANPAYGEFQVERAGEAGIKAVFHGIPMALEHWHYETFRARPADPAMKDDKLLVQFLTNLRGDVDRLLVPLEPNAPEIVFTRKPPARLTDPVFLQSLTGGYVLVDNPEATVTIALRGERTLTAKVTRQPEYTLEPCLGTDFRLKGLTGYVARFVLDDQGKVTELLLIQPNGVFAATPQPPEK